VQERDGGRCFGRAETIVKFPVLGGTSPERSRKGRVERATRWLDSLLVSENYLKKSQKNEEFAIESYSERVIGGGGLSSSCLRIILWAVVKVKNLEWGEKVGNNLTMEDGLFKKVETLPSVIGRKYPYIKFAKRRGNPLKFPYKKREGITRKSPTLRRMGLLSKRKKKKPFQKNSPSE